MPMNLTDWLGANPWALWLTLAVLLGVAETLSMDFVLIMIAVGAVAGAVLGAIEPSMWYFQILAAGVVSVGLLALARPTLMRHVNELPGYRSSTDKMVGSSGVATSDITGDGGEIKVDGQTWTARVYTPRTVITKGTEIEVYEIDGAIAVVYPKYGELPTP